MKNTKTLILSFLLVSSFFSCSLFDTSGGRNTYGGNWNGTNNNQALPSSSIAEITSFAIGSNVGIISGNSISVTMPYGTSMTSLTPLIVYSGKSINPVSGVTQNFSSPLSYIVTAMDGSTQSYAVTVTVASVSSKDITYFSINGVVGTITGTNISVTLPSGTDVASLIPTISITGISVNPASGDAQNFSSPVTYTVTAGDNTTEDYLATVNVTAPTYYELYYL